MSLHHVRLIHGSDPEPVRRSADRLRDPLCADLCAPGRRQPDSATLVRGEDRYRNFEPEQRPDADLSPAAIAHHAAITGAHAQILMRGTDREMRA